MSTPNNVFKEQMAEARRTQILMGAAQIFAQKGFHKATTKEIAKAAGVAEGTIYNYFNNKRELLLAMVKMISVQPLQSNILSHTPDTPKEFLMVIIKDRLKTVEQHGHILAPLIAEIFTDASLREEVYSQLMQPVMALVENYLEDQIQAGNLRPINPTIITRSFMGTLMLNAALKFSNLDPNYSTISTDELTDEIVSFFLDGILQKP